MPNNLKNENSPYLLQHADNPVDWYPWSEKPFELAKKYDKPVFLSIGYSSCHWCHVMEKESFSDHSIADYMNEHFISIKVDREERPDIDSIYMESLQALSGSGGWPASLFLTPEKIPFFAGTYFPLEDRGNYPSFMRVLQSVVEYYSNKKPTVIDIGNQLIGLLQAELKNEDIPNTDHIKNALDNLVKSFDKDNGGFHNAPKFPQPHILEFLIYLKDNYARFSSLISDEDLNEMLNISLYKMASGGIYDQIGGGFHRYSVDAKWLVPHFEKMLYDNAFLAKIYSKAHGIYSDTWMKFISDDILDYLIMQMSDKSEGFYAAEDADSEGEEGKYYVWSYDDLIKTFNDKEFQLAKDLFDFNDKGNFEGKNILTGGFTKANKANKSYEIDAYNNIKSSLFNIREQRIPPFKDKKIITSWNGMTITALMQNYLLSFDEKYLNKSIDVATYINSFITENNELPRYIINSKPFYSPTLEDYAYFIEALFKLHQGTLDFKWLDIAMSLTDKVIESYWDSDSSFLYDSSNNKKDLFIRPKSLYDNPYTSSSSKMTELLYLLGSITGKVEYLDIVDRLIDNMIPYINKVPMHTLSWAKLTDLRKSDKLDHLVIIHDEKNVNELVNKLNSEWATDLIYFGKSYKAKTNLDILDKKILIDSKTTFYLCRSYTCKMPTNSIKDINNQIKDLSY